MNTTGYKNDEVDKTDKTEIAINDLTNLIELVFFEILNTLMVDYDDPLNDEESMLFDNFYGYIEDGVVDGEWTLNDITY